MQRREWIRASRNPGIGFALRPRSPSGAALTDDASRIVTCAVEPLRHCRIAMRGDLRNAWTRRRVQFMFAGARVASGSGHGPSRGPRGEFTPDGPRRLEPPRSGFGHHGFRIPGLRDVRSSRRSTPGCFRAVPSGRSNRRQYCIVRNVTPARRRHFHDLSVGRHLLVENAECRV